MGIIDWRNSTRVLPCRRNKQSELAHDTAQAAGTHLAFCGEEEVEPLMMRLDTNTVFSGVVFDQQLLQEEQSLPLFSFLPHLDQTVPVVLGLSSVTVRTHLVGHSVLHHEGLLEDGPAHHLGLHLQLHLQPLAVGLRPQEVGVDQLDFAETLQLLETEGHQLPALQSCLDPLLWRLEISLTEPAELNGHLQAGTELVVRRELYTVSYLLWDSLSDVNLSPETSHTEVGRVWLYRSPALTTENLANCPHQVVHC